MNGLMGLGGLGGMPGGMGGQGMGGLSGLPPELLQMLLQRMRQGGGGMMGQGGMDINRLLAMLGGGMGGAPSGLMG